MEGHWTCLEARTAIYNDHRRQLVDNRCGTNITISVFAERPNVLKWNCGARAWPNFPDGSVFLGMPHPAVMFHLYPLYGSSMLLSGEQKNSIIGRTKVKQVWKWRERAKFTCGPHRSPNENGSKICFGHRFWQRKHCQLSSLITLVFHCPICTRGTNRKQKRLPKFMHFFHWAKTFSCISIKVMPPMMC